MSGPGRRRRGPALPAARVGMVALALANLAGCTDGSTADPGGPRTGAEGSRETLPAGTVLRVGVAPDLVPALAAELIAGALRAQGAAVTTVPLSASGAAAADDALGSRADVAVVVGTDPEALRADAPGRGWVVVDEVPGDLGGGEGLAVVTADASRELGDLLEATVGAVTASLGPSTLAELAAAVVEDGRSTADVVQDHLVEVGLAGTGNR